VSDLLTPAEREAVATAAALANQVYAIIGDGGAEEGDLAEAVHHIHAIQRMILAQAAARAYPDLYRLLGGDGIAPPPSSLTAAVDAYKRERGL
jgi:hypothetical protein